jgi:DNA-binding winged helix-turn-helix (wHTH) protein/TolB-like protein
VADDEAEEKMTEDVPVSSIPSFRFRFGLFEFNPANRELRREGFQVRLQPQPALLLSYFLEHAGEIISREDLRSAIWGDATFVDFDRGLNFCISQVRMALRDDASGPRFVRTIPKVGYQFIAPVERVFQSPALVRESRFSTRKLLRSKVALAFSVLLVVCFGVWGAYIWKSHKGTSPIVAVVRFDNETGVPDVSRLSDGVTDDLVAQLTSESVGRFEVIGNAQVLRLPRGQRDLNAIAGSLHANYIVLGQLQANGNQIRLLAHLIHMPEQTHVWVVRIDRVDTDPLKFQAEAAQKISEQFSPRLARGETAPFARAGNR